MKKKSKENIFQEYVFSYIKIKIYSMLENHEITTILFENGDIAKIRSVNLLQRYIRIYQNCKITHNLFIYIIGVFIITC